MLLTPLPFPDADRLVYIAGTSPGSDLPDEFGASAELLVQFREQSKLLEHVAAYNSYTSTLRVGDRAERIRMSSPTNAVFATLGATPMLGRLPTATDEDRAVVLSHALWTTWFGSDSAVIGKAYYVSGTMRTIIGVMQPGFEFPLGGTMLWISNDVRPEDITPGRFGIPRVGRMKPGSRRSGSARVARRRVPRRSVGGSPNYAAYGAVPRRRRPRDAQTWATRPPRSGWCSARGHRAPRRLRERGQPSRCAPRGGSASSQCAAPSATSAGS